MEINHSFAKHLENIALSIDIVNDSTLLNIKKAMDKYFSEIDVKFYEFLTFQEVDNSPGLTTNWHNGVNNWSSRIKNDKGQYQGQISFAYDYNKKVCIIAKNNKSLSEANGKYKNLWKNRDEKIEIPDYVNLSDSPTFASIMIPVQNENRIKTGIFNFEFGSSFENSLHLHSELELLVQAFSKLFYLNKARNNQESNTQEAVNTLTDLSKFHVNFKKPAVFVAFANNADSAVMVSIKNVLKQFKDDINIIDWTKKKTAGNINEQILNDIKNCTFGVCYFSKETENKNMPYEDSSNVLFEAGMIYGLSRIADKGPINWLPIRESVELSGEIPFDFASERLVIVPREHGKLVVDHFEKDLYDHFFSLIDK